MKRYMLLLTACVVVLLSACASNGIPSYVQTDGFSQRLPNAGEKVAVWGESEEDIGAVTIWLQQRQVEVVERAKLKNVFHEQNLRLSYSNDLDADLMSVGRMLGATQIIFVETPLHPNVAHVRGVDVETGQVLWQGMAEDTDRYNHSESVTQLQLIRHALAAAWASRPGGKAYAVER